MSFPRAHRSPFRGVPAPSGALSPVVHLTDVSATVERTPVLRGLSMTVAPGEAVGLVGANGSGKSTLLRLLATLLPPTTGTGLVLGARLGTRDVERVRPAIALVGHTPALYPRLTLGENLTFYCRLTGRSPDAAEAALTRVGLGRAAGRPADRCSHGMLRRAELARVLIASPCLLLLDEAHAGLDRGSARLVDVVVDEVRERNGAAVVVSHERSRLDGIANRVLEIRDGSLESADRPAQTLDGVLS